MDEVPLSILVGKSVVVLAFPVPSPNNNIPIGMPRKASRPRQLVSATNEKYVRVRPSLSPP